MTLFTLQNQTVTKAFALFTAIVMVLGLVPVSVFAQVAGDAVQVVDVNT